ncbi:sulfite exporter TauE/SafE family protein [Halomonas huangheensis]|uniref:Urease accessory protein UreH-like transmembrane domain-containing protein n=1 Tax=Halomonas huangheensis TaxID=1178482 RepID=W1N3A8_9GAMM|nr:sulfite exporter TauE/SafE family protein [Halomonas huangheensis]ALM51572.1 copper resistance protein [Halomonas huangheensis]ERL50052.1 hypothetical protein BJB45_02675 [Halomonas huangheensis]
MNPTGLDLPPLAAAFVFGLLGGAHCVGMCGGIMSALTFAVPPSMRRPSRMAALLLGYNAGRITSYALAGAIVAGLGALVGLAPGVRTVLQWMSSLMLCLMALYIADIWKGLRHIEALGKRYWRYLEPVGRALLPVTRPHQAILLGALWGWLPCGLVYSMLSWSLATATPSQGAMLMLAFGTGTLPALLVTGVAADQIRRLLNSRATRWLAALLVIALAIWQLIVTQQS